VLNSELLAQLVKLMVATGCSLAIGKQAVRELLAVVGQQLLNLDRASLFQGPQEGLGASSALVVFDGDKHPARGPVDGDKQVAAFGLVLHLGQILHIHVQVARLVELESPVRLAGRLGLEGVQVTHAMAAQTPV
jgi:hypothetical protein